MIGTDERQNELSPSQAAQPGLCPLQIQALRGRGGGGGESCSRSFWVPTQGWPAPPLHQPHLSTLRRFGDQRRVIVCPPTPTPTPTKSNQSLPKPPGHRRPQPRCWDRSYSCVLVIPTKGKNKTKQKVGAGGSQQDSELDTRPPAFTYSPPPAPVTSTTLPLNRNIEAINPVCSGTHTH